MKVKTAISFFCFAFLYSKIIGQTCCSAGAPITSSFDIASFSTKSIVFQVDYEYNDVNLLIDNNHRLVNDPRRRNGHNALFKTDFIVNDKWAFSAFLPLVIQNRMTFSESESAVGLGDFTLISQYIRPSVRGHQFKLSAGIKFPTGNQHLSDNRGINLSPDMQSGSGTFDLIGRLAFVKEHSFIRNLTNQTAIFYRFNTTNKHFGDPDKINGRSFKFGNEAQFTTVFSYLFIAKTWFIIPEAGLLIRHTRPNKEEGLEAPNSGGYWFRIPIGLQLQPGGRFSVRAFGEIPVKQYLKGLQITTRYKIGIQFRYQISLADATNIFSKN